MRENRKFSIVWSSAQMLYWLYCLIMSTKAPDFLMCRHIYFLSFSICFLALVLSIFYAPKALWLIHPIAIAVDIALLGAGIEIARLLAPKTIIIFASVLVIPVFFICDTLSTVILLFLNAAAFTAIGLNRMDPETFRWTLTNLLIFSSVGLILGYFVNKDRFDRYFFAEAAMKLAESNAKLAELQTRYAYYDQMTNLQNRRAFEEKIAQLTKERPSDCCVIMADINGLKEMNDTLGHDAGDELIIGSAECVEKILDQLEKSGNRWKGKYADGISIACGFASSDEFEDLPSLLKAADQRMYVRKSDFYRKSGKDRRHR